MSDLLTGRPREGRRFKAGNSGSDPITIKAGIGDGTTASSATPLLKFVGTTATTKNGDNNITQSNVGSTAGSPNRAVLVEVEANQTSGVLVIGKVYRIVTLLEADAFTNCHAGTTDSVGLAFTATGTTPTDWTGLSTLVNTEKCWLPLHGTS
tara:strand:- start:41 stop:496 length:456 start_codon:yes stop_codon:yes gene_type:complete